MTGKNDLRPLTPEKGLSADVLGEYYDALNYALDDQDIHNIALSGSYGSGKSSILGSYENVNPEKNFIHITLAHFDQPYLETDMKGSDVNATGNQSNGNQKDSKCDDEKSQIVNILEGKILNQLLHQIKPKSIPLSAFRIKTPTSGKRIWSVCAYGVCFAFLMLYHFYFSLWSDIVRDLTPGRFTSFFMWTISPGVRTTAAIAFVMLILLGVFVLLRVLQRKNSLQKFFKRIDVKGTVGIELFEDGDESCFDKYLNEVLYLFEHSGATAVVFEDLDRYDVVQIFEKLRVISDLLQQRKKQGISQSDQDSPIPKFLYLIRDSIFTAGERTKFFDLIIPVVPVVASDNAYDKILERVGKTEFSNRLLRNISIYIGDMRLINNIINEYLIFKSQIGRTKLNRDPDRMLSMMVYKNLFPEDFELLRHRRGYVAWVISQKANLIAHQTGEIDKKINTLRQRIKASHNESLKTIDELNAVFFPYTGPIDIIDGKAAEQGLTRVELVGKLLDAKNAQYSDYYHNTKTIDLKSFRQKMEEDPDYQERLEAVQDKSEAHQQELRNAITDLQNQRSKITISSLGELLAEAKRDFREPNNAAMRSMNIRPSIFSQSEFPLLQYLLQNSYIDENYAVYISYFYPTSLDQWDKNYVLAVHSHRSLGYDYELHNPATVLESIEPTYFADESMWNLSLFDYLVSQEKHTEEQRKCIAAWLDGTERAATQGTKGFNFILGLWKQTQRKDLLTQLINWRNPEWIHLWTDNGSLTDDEWRLFAVYTLTASDDPNVLDAVDKDRWLSNAIAADRGFLMTPLPNQPQLRKILSTRSVRVSSLECCPENTSLADGLYYDDSYQLTPDVLTHLLTTRYGAEQNTSLSKSYTYLLQKPKEPLSLYVEKFLNLFVDALADSGTQLNDSPEAKLTLLNHTKLDRDHKKRYLSLSGTTLKWLTEVTDKELWPELLAGGHMEMHWKNVADYYCSFAVKDKSLPEPLSNYIEQGGGAFNCDLDDLIQRMGEDKAKALLNDLIVCTGLSNSCYQTMWKSIGVIYSIFTVKDLPDEYIEAIIVTKTVSMTVENINLIRTSYPGHMNSFILSDANKFIELASDNSIALKAGELSVLLLTRKLSVNQEERLLNLFDGTLPAAGKSYHPETMAKILTDHFDTGEAGWFLANFKQLDPRAANAFINWAKSAIAILIKSAEKEKVIPEDVYAACLNTFTSVQARDMRRYLPNKDYDRVCNRNTRPHFADTESNRTILAYFQEQGWISSWKVSSKGKIQAFSKRKEPHITTL